MEWQGRCFPVGENTKLGGGTQYRAAEKPGGYTDVTCGRIIEREAGKYGYDILREFLCILHKR